MGQEHPKPALNPTLYPSQVLPSLHSAPQGRDVAHEGQPPRDTGARPPGPEFLLAAAAGGGGFDICRESPPCLALIISRLTSDFCSMIQAAGNASAGAAFQERGGFSSLKEQEEEARACPGHNPSPLLPLQHQDTTPTQPHQGKPPQNPFGFPLSLRPVVLQSCCRVGTSHRQHPSLLLQPWLDASPNPPWP